MSTAVNTALRQAKRAVRIPEGSCCLLCLLSDPVCLVEVDRTFLELHHIVGRIHDGQLTVWLCRNCHALATEGLLAAGASMRREPDPSKRVALMLRALAVFLKMLAEAVQRWAALLEEGDSW